MTIAAPLGGAEGAYLAAIAATKAAAASTSVAAAAEAASAAAEATATTAISHAVHAGAHGVWLAAISAAPWAVAAGVTELCAQMSIGARWLVFVTTATAFAITKLSSTVAAATLGRALLAILWARCAISLAELRLIRVLIAVRALAALLCAVVAAWLVVLACRALTFCTLIALCSGWILTLGGGRATVSSSAICASSLVGANALHHFLASGLGRCLHDITAGGLACAAP